MTGHWIDCANCGEPIHLAAAQYETMTRNHQTFYCLWGHKNFFPEGGKTEAEKEADRVRQERDRLKQNAAYLEDRLRIEREAREGAERRVYAARGQITKLKKRAAAGVCPCCNRQFADLQRHMQAKHKDFAAEEAA